MLTTKGIWWTAGSAVLTILGLAVGSSPAVLLGTALGLHVALAWALLSNPRIDASIQPGLREVTEGDHVPTVVAMASRSRGTIVVDFAVDLPATFDRGKAPVAGTISLRRGREHRIEIQPVPLLHGPWTIGPLRFLAHDPAWLVTRTLVGAPARPVRAYPRIEDLTGVPLKSRMATPYIGTHEVQQPGDGFELYALRGYRSGDSIRSINWRASARSSGLIVNQRVKESFASVVVVLDGRDWERMGILEHAPWWRSGRAAIAVADAFMSSRDRVTFHLLADGAKTIQPQPPDRQRRQVLDLVASHRPGGNTSIVEWIGHTVPNLRTGSLVVLLSSLESEDDIGTAVARLRARDMPVLVVSPASQWPEPLDPIVRAAKETRERNLAKLKSTGARVLDWSPGHVLGMGLLEVVG